VATGKGFDAIPLRIPDKWDPEWFLGFVRDVLALGDVRNADAGPGISVDGTSDGTATISGSVDVEELTDSNFVVAEATALLANARVLDGEGGVIEIEDIGPGATIRVKIAAHGVSFDKLPIVAPYSVVGNLLDEPAQPQAIAAGADDRILIRTGGALGFAQLTIGTAPDALWTYAKIQNVAADRVLGRKTSTGPIEELTADEVLDMLGAAADGALLAKVGGAWTPLAPGADDQVLTMVAGAPAWADLPDFALADKTFVTATDESATLANSRQLISGTGSTVDTATAGKVKVNVP
jgi:hypothetical protein